MNIELLIVHARAWFHLESKYYCNPLTPPNVITEFGFKWNYISVVKESTWIESFFQMFCFDQPGLQEIQGKVIFQKIKGFSLHPETISFCSGWNAYKI